MEGTYAEVARHQYPTPEHVMDWMDWMTVKNKRRAIQKHIEKSESLGRKSVTISIEDMKEIMK